MDDEGCFTILVAVVVIALVVIGIGFGYIIWADEIDTGSDLGLPIANADLSEDGLRLSFNIGGEQFEAVLTKAVNRPPNLSSASHLYVDNNLLMLTTSENQRLFDYEVQYSVIRAISDT